MKENISDLKIKFNKIKQMGWIPAVSHGNGNVGITFETILGKERENFPIADYNGIEIKTSIKENGRPYVTLFNCAPDGKYVFETQLLKDKYGIRDNTFKMYKNFYARISADKLRRINDHYMKLKINFEKEKILLVVYDLHFNKVEEECFWDFATIKEKYNKKITYLAYINAEKRFTHNEVHFRYIDINFYKIKNFEHFLKLLSLGKIKVCFKVGFYKNQKKFGKTYDHGTGFEIRKEDILKLYQKYE